MGHRDRREELHNNHHAFASSAKLSSRGWEFDIGWLYIRALETLGLARVKKVPPRPVIVPEKTRVDGDTLTAVITNRLQVMARYAREVVGAVYRDELAKAHGAYRTMLRHAKRLLVREESLLSEESRRRLETVLQTSQALETVYEYRRRLQAIWKQRTASQESLLAACRTGVSRPRRAGSGRCRSSPARCGATPSSRCGPESLREDLLRIPPWRGGCAPSLARLLRAPCGRRRFAPGETVRGTRSSPIWLNEKPASRRVFRLVRGSAGGYLIFASLYATCFRTTGSNFLNSSFSGVVFLFFVVV